MLNKNEIKMLLNDYQAWSFKMIDLWNKQKKLEKKELKLMKNEDLKYNKNIKNQLLLDLEIQKIEINLMSIEDIKLKTQINYNTDYIYYYKYVLKVINDDTELSYVYVGSTRDCKTRQKSHRVMALNGENVEIYGSNGNTTFYKKVRELGGLDKFTFIIIDSRLVKNNTERRQIEQKYIDLYANLNTGKTYTSVEDTKIKQKNCNTNRNLKKKFNLTSLENINVEDLQNQWKEQKSIATAKAKEDRESKNICEICGGTFLQYKIKQHNDTKKHQSKLK